MIFTVDSDNIIKDKIPINETQETIDKILNEIIEIRQENDSVEEK